jgi:hypothetical protein
MVLDIWGFLFSEIEYDKFIMEMQCKVVSKEIGKIIWNLIVK